MKLFAQFPWVTQVSIQDTRRLCGPIRQKRNV